MGQVIVTCWPRINWSNPEPQSSIPLPSYQRTHWSKKLFCKRCRMSFLPYLIYFQCSEAIKALLRHPPTSALLCRSLFLFSKCNTTTQMIYEGSCMCLVQEAGCWPPRECPVKSECHEKCLLLGPKIQPAERVRSLSLLRRPLDKQKDRSESRDE